MAKLTIETVFGSEFADMFIQGQRDCQNGVEHKAGKGEPYDQGYATEYASEQIATELSLRAEK